MAGVGFATVTGEITTGTSVKTLIQVVAAANHRLRVREISISFKGILGTDAPILVQVLRQTTAGTMSALTPVKLNDSDDETLQVTAQHTATAEPTAGDVLMSEEVHPQSGYTWQSPFGGEIPVKGGGRLGVRVTAGASTSAVVRIFGDE
jgi:hypothetical protein